MYGYSRAARATSSRRAKQELVRILFASKYSRKGPEAHRKLDHSIYSYAELRSAYLDRIQAIHPDKCHSSTPEVTDKAKSEEFVALQEAWSKYENFAKMMKKVDGDATEASFTMFGVGCSFADNEAERALREEITDQACRGWFSAGSLGEGSKHNDSEAAQGSKQISLLSDDMFSSDDHDRISSEKETKKKEEEPATNKQRKSLVGHLLRPHQR